MSGGAGNHPFRSILRFKIALLLLFILSFMNSRCIFADEGEDLLKKGIDEFKQENFEEALEYLVQARLKFPGSSSAAYYLGLTYKQTGDYREAAKHLKDAVELAPPVDDAYTELIEVFYASNKLREAEEWIARAEKKGTKPANVAFLKGQVLSKKGKNEEAIKAFKKAKELDASLAQPSDLQIAVLYAQERRFEEAKKSLRAIEEIDPASEIASFAKEYEKALSRTMAAYKPWRFNASVAYQFDDNVVLKPSTTIPAVDVTKDSDSSIVGAFGVTYSPLTKGPWFFHGLYNFYSNTYFKINSHSMISQTVSLIPGRNIRKGAIFLPLSYSYTLIRERKYLSDFLAKPALQIAFSPEHIGRLSLGYEKRDFLQPAESREENRDADVMSASAGYVHPFWEGKGILNLAYELSRENTSGKNWDNFGNKFSLSLLAPTPVKRVSLIASGEIFLQNYRNVNSLTAIGIPGFPTDPTKRRDRTYTASVALLWEIFEGGKINLQYAYTRADSNFAFYDYSRNVYTAGIEYRF